MAAVYVLHAHDSLSHLKDCSVQQLRILVEFKELQTEAGYVKSALK